MISAFLLIAAATSPTPVPGEVKVFKDWYVACDNLWSCEAGTLAEEGGDFTGAMTIRIYREGGPKAPMQIALQPPEDMARGPARLRIDGRTPIGGTQDQEGDSWLDAGQTLATARMLANGKAAALVLSDGKPVAVSLAGSSAALRYMDAVQKRAGTSGAIIATGAKPDTALPPAAPLITARAAPKIAGLPEMKDYPAVIAATRCEYRMEEANDSVYPLGRQGGKDQALALIACDSGAYNFGSVVMLAERPAGDTRAKWRFSPAKFDSAPAWGGDDQVVQVVNADYSPETATLFDRSKSRGPGDCGTANTYAWDGRMFRLTERYLMDDCRGVWEWPRVWLAKVKLLP